MYLFKLYKDDSSMGYYVTGAFNNIPPHVDASNAIPPTDNRMKCHAKLANMLDVKSQMIKFKRFLSPGDSFYYVELEANGVSYYYNLITMEMVEAEVLHELEQFVRTYRAQNSKNITALWSDTKLAKPSMISSSKTIPVDAFTWYRGCVPTSLAMILNYHGTNSAFSGLLHSTFSFSWSGPHSDLNPRYSARYLVDDLAEYWELRSSGGVEGDYAVDGNCTDGVINVTIDHGYHFHSTFVENFNSSELKNEIDLNRPVKYGAAAHARCAFGYNNDGNTIYYYDTWDRSSHSHAISTYSSRNFVTAVPPILVPSQYSAISEALAAVDSANAETVCISVNSGTCTEIDDLTIPSNVILELSPGVTVQLATGKKITVNGTLIAKGESSNPITFDKSGSNGWYGIVFEDPSDDNASAFEHCEVSNASYGIKLRKSSVNIKNCTFSNCSFGIYTWNSESDIHDNSIYNCGSRAMYIYHSNCWIEDNTIYGEYAPTTYAKGIHIKGDYDNEDPIIAGNLIERCKSDGLLISFSSPYIGYNEINENQGIGLKADLYGNPEVEENEILSSGSDGMYIDDDALPILAMGCNAFEGNTGYHVNSDQLSAVNASINWWGQSPPNSGKINGNVQYSTYCYNYYCTSWGSGLSKALAAGMTAEEIAAREQLEKGYAFQCEKLYSQAVQEFEAVVAQYPETEEAILALVRIPVCYRKLDRKNDVFSYMESVADDNQDELLGAMALSINVTKKSKMATMTKR